MVRHPFWFILSWGGGPYVQPLEVGPSPDKGCVGPNHVPLWEAYCIMDFGL
jgi:hypothetical protein